MGYLAHRDPKSGREQSVLEHLTNTADSAAQFAGAFGAAELGSLCGILHDIGKYSDRFQRRIMGSAIKVDHSTAGALEARALGNVPAAFCISGHHGGLPDGGSQKSATSDDPTFSGKMKRIVGRDIEDYSAFRSQIEASPAEIPSAFRRDAQCAFFFTRMLYSCLVDADFLDTEHFMSGGTVDRAFGDSLPVLWNQLSDYIAPWQPPKYELDQKRCEILNAAIQAGRSERGLYTLTVPTGGGKTVSSMAFALRHAMENRQRRVIYVIPYTSIIEQTQAVFEKIFGEENVVAHYAAVDYRTDENAELTDKRYLAAENWDAPVIVTTTVQFFESLYANRPSRCRKLHNIAESVIIFDEAQMLPVPYLLPCVSAISQLVRHYGCSAVLCTATQPALNRMFEEMLPEYPPKEICPDAHGMYEYFRRVRFQKDGPLSDEQLAARLSQEKQVLCIVNNRKEAQAVYSLLPKDGSYHLSTMMYPEHRRRTLDEIRNRLRDGEDCRVVSTSLVEAGVDVDFPTVYRALAGLDSMIQAGGRCNREGKRPLAESVVHLFESEKKAPEIVKQNISAAEHVMRSHTDLSGMEAIQAYFEFLYYTLKDNSELDAKGILEKIKSGSMPFASVANAFRIIEGSEFTVYIPLGKGAELVDQLKQYGISRGLMRKLGQYSVGVYPGHFANLIELGAAEKLTENAAVLRDMSLYHEKTGLAFGAEAGQAIFT
ncbi:MAG: CRISPR-associated helicase Cas3' [Oscillospiraceae bacterium]|nr:CRISPR-associated helicase Cas3' [Oscillospiraceae bacterium]